MLRFAKRIWVLLVIALVVVVAFFCVDRFRGFFGHTVLTKPGAGLVNDPAPFNPKVVKYEIFGTGSAATINYLDLDAQPQKAENAALPWTLTLTTTAIMSSPIGWPAPVLLAVAGPMRPRGRRPAWPPGW